MKGNELAQSPNYTVDLAAEYVFRLPSWNVILRSESNWSDRVYFSGFDRNEVSQAPYSLQNAFTTLTPAQGNWRVTGYIKNVGDLTIKASANVASTLVGTSSVPQLTENLAALEHPDFTAEELAMIDRYAVDSGIDLWRSSSDL